MLSISVAMSAGDAVRYYQANGKEAYYLDNLWQVGRWAGSAVEQLDLPETVAPRTFEHLLEGFSPDGRQALVQNAGHKNRDAGWDLTFSAPKSVSVLWALAPAAERQQIEQAHAEAVKEALKYVEVVAGLTRRGKGGAIKEHADLLFATFFHGDSRAHDPNVHTHAFLINLGLRQDGTTGALRTLEVFQCKMRAGELYRKTLGQSLTRRLSLTLDKEKVGFHVRGVPKDLCLAFSSRSRDLRKVMRERGLEGAVAAKVATLLTRPKKAVLSQEKFFARCQAVGQKLGWGQREAQRLVEHCRDPFAVDRTQRTPEMEAAHTQSPPPPANEESHRQPRPPGGEPPQRDDARTRPPSDPEGAQATPRPAADGPGVPPREPNSGRARTEDLGEPPDSQNRRAAAGTTGHTPANDPTSEPAGRAAREKGARENTATGRPAQAAGAGADQSRRLGDQGHTQRDAGAGERAGRQGRADQSNRGEKRAADAQANGRAQAGPGQGAGQKATRNEGKRTRFEPEPPERRMRRKPGKYDIRVKLQRLFPKAPFWSLAQFVKVPVIILPPHQPRWGKIVWRKRWKFVELRIQHRRVFPDAPKWSRAYGHTFRNFHLVWGRTSPSAALGAKEWQRPAQAGLGFSKSPDQARVTFRNPSPGDSSGKLENQALRKLGKPSTWTRAQPTDRPPPEPTGPEPAREQWHSRGR
jgi:conjugative relaxase-like TrwC/TraI family protein